MSTEVTEAFHIQSTQPSDKLNIKQGDETGANIIVPVVVPVAIVLLIFVIALIFICIKRKHKLKLDSLTKVISNSKQYVASYSCSHAHGADEHFLDETGTPDAMSPYYDDDQKTATYDTTNTHVRSKDVGQPMDNKGHEDVNVYNKLGDHEREETYDQTTILKITANVLISNNVYDTNETLVSEYACAIAGTSLSSNVEKLPDHVYSTSQ